MEKKHNANLTSSAKALRRDMTDEEKKLWYDYLRNCSVRFSRQKVHGRYIVDFYSAEACLVIEVDGAQHYLPENREQDEERTAFLEHYGLKVVRVLNRDVKNNFSGVCSYLEQKRTEALSRGKE